MGLLTERRDSIGSQGYTCYTDGSWVNQWSGGVGFILFKGEELILYRLDKANAFSDFQAEAWALRDAIRLIRDKGDNILYIQDRL